MTRPLPSPVTGDKYYLGSNNSHQKVEKEIVNNKNTTENYMTLSPAQKFEQDLKNKHGGGGGGVGGGISRGGVGGGGVVLI